MNAPNILVFDSGIGGLSVVQAIRERIPNSTIQYLADNERFPYGSLPAPELLTRVVYLIEASIRTTPCDIIVIACNTASTLVLETLRDQIRIPIVGVVPAIKPAAALSKTGHIGLLATPATIARDYTNKLIEQFAPSIHVHRIGSQTLVALAEQQDSTPKERETAIRKALAPWLDTPLLDKIDTVVLACTHFPLLKVDIQNTLTPTIRLVDSGEAIARRVEQLLTTIDVKAAMYDTATFTDVTTVSAPTRALLQQHSITRIKAFNDE